MLDDLSFRSYDFIERGFDVAVHTTPIRDSNLVTRKIANLRWLLCASPDYLKTHGELETPRDLARHQCLVHINSDPSDRVWRLRSGNGQVSIKVQGRCVEQRAHAAQGRTGIFGHRDFTVLLRQRRPQERRIA